MKNNCRLRCLITCSVIVSVTFCFYIFLYFAFNIGSQNNPDYKLRETTWKITKSDAQINLNDVGATEQDIIQQIQQRIPSLPITFWNEKKSGNLKYNSTCAKFPDLFSIEYNNEYWQSLYTSNGTFQFFSAYLDVRKNNKDGPTIRILGMINRIEPAVKTHCHIWFENKKEPEIVPIFQYKYIWVKAFGNYKQGVHQPYLMSCKVPKKHWNSTAPSAVSVVEKPCDNATNILSVYFNVPSEPKKDFAVCVKGLNFLYTDLTIRLAEWIEVLNLLGADKIFFYELAVHPNVKNLLDYYEREGKIHVTPLKLAGTQPTHPILQYFFLSRKIAHKRQNELIPYNDCFYKHMYEYKYITLLDIDEVIMPIKQNSWKDLMDVVKEKSKNKIRSHYYVQNVYFLENAFHQHDWFEGIPRYMHMLQHVYRSKNFTKPGAYVKSFVDTEKGFTLHNHSPFSCLGQCLGYSIDKEDAKLQHYRESCVAELRKTCDDFRNNTVIDTTIWKFKEALIDRVSTTLKNLRYPETD